MREICLFDSFCFSVFIGWDDCILCCSEDSVHYRYTQVVALFNPAFYYDLLWSPFCCFSLLWFGDFFLRKNLLSNRPSWRTCPIAFDRALAITCFAFQFTSPGNTEAVFSRTGMLVLCWVRDPRWDLSKELSLVCGGSLVARGRGCMSLRDWLTATTVVQTLTFHQTRTWTMKSNCKISSRYTAHCFNIYFNFL